MLGEAAIRGATGQPINDPTAIGFDAMLGAAGGLAGQAANAYRVSQMSSVAKGKFADEIAGNVLGTSALGQQISRP